MSKKYLVRYFFDGEGEVEIKAKNEEEAKRKFYNGEYIEGTEDEYGNNYTIDSLKIRE